MQLDITGHIIVGMSQEVLQDGGDGTEVGGTEATHGSYFLCELHFPRMNCTFPVGTTSSPYE